MKTSSRGQHILYAVGGILLLVIAHMIDSSYPNDMSGQGIAAVLNIAGLIITISSIYNAVKHH